MPKALIAGAGIAGLAAAVALARNGWQVIVHERAEALRELGAGLQMSPNACKALKALGVLHLAEERATVPEAAEMRDGLTGDVIFEVPLGEAAARRWKAPYLHVHRAELLRIIADAAVAAGVEIRLGKEAVEAVSLPAEASLHLADGAAERADLIIAADGIRSTLRKRINKAEEPRFSGQVAYRALVEAADIAEKPPRRATVWAGDGRHLVTYYLRDWSLINVVGVIEDPDWTAETWSTEGDPGRLAGAYEGWSPVVGSVLGAVKHCYLWGLFDRPEQVRWVDGRIALIGDAAHPMLPFMAQGAAMGLEDAVLLARCLGERTNVREGLQEWEDARWHRVNRVLQRSRANGRLYHQPPGLGRLFSHEPLRWASRIAPDMTLGQLDWLYGYDPATAR